MQPLDEILGRQVDVDDLVGASQELVGDALLDPHARRAFDHVVETFEVLDVQRADDVDARRKEVFHILETLFGLRAGRVRVGELVHECHGRRAGDDGSGVHLAQLHAPVLGHERRYDLQFADLRRGLGAGMRLDVTDDHVHAAFL